MGKHVNDTAGPRGAPGHHKRGSHFEAAPFPPRPREGAPCASYPYEGYSVILPASMTYMEAERDDPSSSQGSADPGLRNP